jgi:hypothetical protein
MRQPRIGEYPVPPGARTYTCASCGAEIVWAASKKGFRIPLSVKTIEQDAGGQRFAVTHFADCPNAAQHRKAKQ